MPVSQQVTPSLHNNLDRLYRPLVNVSNVLKDVLHVPIPTLAQETVKKDILKSLMLKQVPLFVSPALTQLKLLKHSLIVLR